MSHVRYTGALTVVAVAVALLVLTPSMADASTYTVNSNADAVDASPGDGTCATAPGHCTLRAAIQEANSGAGADEIIIPADAYNLAIAGVDEDAAATGDLDILADVTIRGAGRGVTIVNGASLDRVFDVPSQSTDIDVTIQDLTISSGYLNPGPGQAELGAGLRNFGSISILRLDILANSSAHGGALANHGAAFIDGALIQGNSGGSCAGIMNEPFATIEIHNSSITRNDTPGSGGGLCVFSGGSALLVNTRVFDNIGAHGGGGIYNSGTLTLFRSSVFENQTAGDGGGILNQNFFPTSPGTARLFMTESTIRENGAVRNGGGIANTGFTTPADATFGARIEIEASTISSNVTGGRGGGIYNAGSTVIATNTTISSNRAGIAGGGISNHAETIRSMAFVRLQNATLASNQAVSGEGVLSVISGDATFNEAIVRARKTIFAGSQLAYCVGFPPVSEGGNMDDDGTCAQGPDDMPNTNALLGPLQNNGGWTATHALLPGSAAIDAADCDPPLTDQRGVMRGTGLTGVACDIGAYEFIWFVDSDGDGIEDVVDAQPGVQSSTFLDTASLQDTTGTIGNRRGLTIRVEDLPPPAGVRVTAAGAGGPADIPVSCDAGPIGLSLTSGDVADVTCGSTIIGVHQGPVEFMIGGLLVVVPTGSGITISVNDDMTLLLTNSSDSEEPVIVGGTSVEPGASLPIQNVDSDGDGIPDIDDACPSEPEDIDNFRDSDGCPEPCPGGDVNGDDRVTTHDLLLTVRALWSRPGSARWNPAADFDGNSRVDIGDLFFVLRALSNPGCW
jgi:CSLREA domain-containing protein